MLTELLIENFAIIERLHIRFFSGFSVLTGETGAGKSIIIDALQCALGARVGQDAVREGARFAVVEAVFDLPEVEARLKVEQVLAGYGVEDDDTVILRREINAAGRSSARLNGRAVPVSALSAIGEMLVDIHGQSEHLSILRRDRQLDALDRYAGLMQQRARVAMLVDRYEELC